MLSAEVIAQVEPGVGRFHDWLADGSGFRTVVVVDAYDALIGHTTWIFR